MTPFHVGMKVVCIYECIEDCYPDERCPIPGSIYTIRQIETDTDYDDGEIGLIFEEIVNPFHYDSGTAECHFYPGHFRPLVKTDISIFTSMLIPSPKQKVLT